MTPRAQSIRDLSLHEKRKWLADWCRMLGQKLGTVGTPEPAPSAPSLDLQGLSPRMRETLEHLLHGDSEKQVAVKLGVSPHTVHIYVKSLYRHFNVCSRGELLARCLTPTR